MGRDLFVLACCSAQGEPPASPTVVKIGDVIQRASKAHSLTVGRSTGQDQKPGPKTRTKNQDQKPGPKTRTKNQDQKPGPKTTRMCIEICPGIQAIDPKSKPCGSTQGLKFSRFHIFENRPPLPNPLLVLPNTGFLSD